MKRFLWFLAAGLLLPIAASAIPKLQLDASSAYYDTSTESTVATTNAFTVFAIMEGLDPTQTYYLSAALVFPDSTDPSTLGSFEFNGQTVGITSDMTYGSPDAQMPPHGVYPTWFKLISFTFDGAAKTTNYNVEDVVGLHTGPVANPAGDAWFVPFEVDLSGITGSGTSVVFDLYTFELKGQDLKLLKAPFSHNAEGNPTTRVPDGGATVGLLALALLGLAGLTRQKAA